MNNYNRNIMLMIFFLSLVVGAIILKYLDFVFMPICLAIILAFTLDPVVTWLINKKVPKIISISIAFLLLLLIAVFFIIIFSASIATFADELPKYQEKFKNIFLDITKTIDFYRVMINEKTGIGFNEVNYFDMAKSIDWSFIGTYMVKSIYSISKNFFSYGIFVLIFLMFTFTELSVIDKKVECAFPDKGDKFTAIIHQIKKDVVTYLSLKFIVSAITGLIVYIILGIIGMDFALLFAFLAFLLNFIPTIGSIIVVFLITLFSVAQFYPSITTILFVLFSLGITEFLIGNIIEPKFQGTKFNLSPVIVLASMLIWNWIWGPVGMFISIPMVMIMKICFNAIPMLKPFSIIIGEPTSAKDEKKFSFKNIKEIILHKIFKKGAK